LYGQLAGSVIYANASLRANPHSSSESPESVGAIRLHHFRRFAIVLLRIADPTHIERCVSSLWHTATEAKLIVDLVTVEDQALPATLNDQIMIDCGRVKQTW
jgi:hypothetical protein